MIGVPLAVSIGVALALVAMAVTAHAGERMCGSASWYGHESGNRTASGAMFRPHGLSFAMRSRGYGKVYAVTYGGRTIRAVHNDYGPAKWTGRQFDLSEGLAAALGLKRHGVGRVCVERVR